MGRCQEFGPQIRPGCGHIMVAGKDSCRCPECGVVCGGRFSSCDIVWAAGPRPTRQVGARAEPNGGRRAGAGARPLERGAVSSGVGDQSGRGRQVVPVDLRPRQSGNGRPQEAAMSQVGLVNQMVTEVAASMSEMVRDVMDQVVRVPQSHSRLPVPPGGRSAGDTRRPGQLGRRHR